MSHRRVCDGRTPHQETLRASENLTRHGEMVWGLIP